MVATALCGTEMKMLKDKNLQHQHYPIIMGHEGAGIVESVGEGVSTVKAGMNWCLELGNSSNLEPTSGIKSIPEIMLSVSEIKGKILAISQKRRVKSINYRKILNVFFILIF